LFTVCKKNINNDYLLTHNKGWLISIALSFLIILLAGTVGALLFTANDDNTSSFVSVIALTIASIFLASRFPGMLAFRRITLNKIIAAVTLGILIQIIPFGPVDVIQLAPYLAYNVEGKILYIIFLFILLPIVEEIYFRGLLYPVISIGLGNRVGAIVSIVIFTVFHMPAPNSIVFLAITGALYTWLVRSSGSVVPGIIAHCANNICWFILAIKYS